MITADTANVTFINFVFSVLALCRIYSSFVVNVCVYVCVCVVCVCLCVSADISLLNAKQFPFSLFYDIQYTNVS